jgi:hypothetical protein
VYNRQFDQFGLLLKTAAIVAILVLIACYLFRGGFGW